MCDKTMLLVYMLILNSFVLIVCSDTDESIPIILVNRVELETIKDETVKGNELSIATYNYFNGEFVDITCMRSNKNMYDKYQVTINGIKAFYDSFAIDQFSSNNLVGIWMELRAVHNNLTLTCTHTQDGGDMVNVMIKFVLKDRFDDIMDLKINDASITSSRDGNYAYYYTSAENITLTCKTNRSDVMFTESSDENLGYGNNVSKKLKQIQWSKTPDSGISQTYKAYVSDASEPNRSIKIKFEMLPYWYTSGKDSSDRTALWLNVSTNKELFIVYNTSDKHIPYEYEDDENVTVSCCTTDDNKRKYVLGLNNETKGNVNCLSTNIQKTADQNITQECFMFMSEPHKPINYINKIIAYFYKSTEISRKESRMTVQEESGFPYWILLVLGAVITLSISMYVVWNKMKQRNCSLLQRIDNRPAVEKGEDVYSETHNPEALYSIPMKHKLKDDIMTPELNYAVLDIAPSTNVSRNVDNETALYAEVCSDSARYLS